MKVKVKKIRHGIPTCCFNYLRNSKSTKLDKALYQYQYGLKSQNK